MTSTAESQDPDTEHHEYRIVVNAREKIVKSDELTFAEVVHIAFPEPPKPDTVFTVTYRHAPRKPHDGSLTKGEKVEIEDGTIFDVTRTDKS